MKIKQVLLIFGILVLGLVLRLHNYETYPQRGATSDEYTYSFLGLSLLTKGIPISWSHFGVYKDREDVSISGIYFPIVKPYFDHPPLFGLLVAGIALRNGENTFEKIQLSTIRLVPIALSMVSMVLVFTLAFRLYGFSIALMALLIYGTATIFVIQSRVVLAENLLTPIFLSVVLLYHRFRRQITEKRIIFLGFLSGIAFWVKEAGISIAIAVVVLTLYDKQRIRHITSFIFIVLAALFGYMMYGNYYGWETFVHVLSIQSFRDIGPSTLYYILSTPIIINKIYYDGWYFFGFLSLAFLLTKWKQHVVLIVPTLIYFFFLLVTLTQNQQIGWYAIPLYPFMVIASAVVLHEAITARTWIFFLFLLLVGLPLIQHGYEEQFGLSPLVYRILFVLLTAPSLCAALFRKNTLFTSLGYAYFTLFLLLSSYLSLTYVHPA